VIAACGNSRACPDFNTNDVMRNFVEPEDWRLAGVKLMLSRK
jgi:hypothetical protein